MRQQNPFWVFYKKKIMKKKLWKKQNRVVSVGFCRYCQNELINTDSFVSFYPSGHAHYLCMQKDDDLKQQVLQSVEHQLHQEKENYAKR
ncbi:MAG: hypothetical protein CBB97_05185 [Candidatus Endolissoclinum sp. TMED37]|nr:MAG: hypothetical protein CBB97_05185 [Candidatus Endolissoclinum sp. TMED37]